MFVYLCVYVCFTFSSSTLVQLSNFFFFLHVTNHQTPPLKSHQKSVEASQPDFSCNIPIGFLYDEYSTPH